MFGVRVMGGAGVIMSSVTVSRMGVATGVRMSSRVMTARLMRAMTAYAAERHCYETDSTES